MKRGTGRRIAEIKKPLAGKTGTTNSNFDTWFIGFTPDLAVGVYVGFDKPRLLGLEIQVQTLLHQFSRVLWNKP